MQDGRRQPAWLATSDASKLTRAITLLALVFLSLAGVAAAQLAAPNEAGVAMGHVHYNVRDVEASKKFWTLLGGTAIKFGNADVVKFPELLVFLNPKEPTGGAAGSAFSHVAFKSKDMKGLQESMKAAGYKTESNNVLTPDGDHIELFQEMSDIVKFIPDPGHDNPVSQRHARPMPGPIGTHHIHIYLAEGDDAKGRDWYVKMFGAVPGIRYHYKAADLPGITMNFLGNPGAKTQAPTKGRTMDHIGFEVKNLEAFCKGLESKGVKFDVPYTKGRNGLATAFLTDPFGTYIELTEGLRGL